MPNRKKLKLRPHGEQPLAFTIQSRDPEDYDPLSDLRHKGDESALETEMRRFGAATRFAFNRPYLIGVLAKVLADAAKALGKPVAGEDLAFKKDHGTNRAFNRMSANFPYAKILEAIARRCRKEGVGFLPANPAYTSCMGFWKYARREGISVHQGAAKVIGRRAPGHAERFDPDLRRRLAVLREQLVAAAEEAERQRRAPAEGTRPRLVGIAKRLRASLSEERLVRCNGHPPGGGEAGRLPGERWRSSSGIDGPRRQLAGPAETPAGVSDRSRRFCAGLPTGRSRRRKPKELAVGRAIQGRA